MRCAREAFVPFEIDALHSSVDVALVLDATGRMLDEAVLLASRASEVFMGLAELAPDVALGLGFSGDYSNRPYGTATEHVAVVPILIGTDLQRLPIYVTGVPMDWTGGNGPEPQSQALYLYATNEPFWDLEPVTCPLGHVGRMCFRPSAARLFLLLTDALFHEGRGGTNAYDRARIRRRARTTKSSPLAFRANGREILERRAPAHRGGPRLFHRRLSRRRTCCPQHAPQHRSPATRRARTRRSSYHALSRCDHGRHGAASHRRSPSAVTS